MAKNKRPFSALLGDPNDRKAVAEALHAPAQLPATESVPEAQPSATLQPDPVGEPVDETPRKQKPGPKPKSPDEKEEYTVITIRKEIHKYLKMAAVQNDIEIRELASDAIEAHPLVVEMMRKFN